MAYKVYYQYNDYKDYPEATEISKSRSRFSSMVLPFPFIGAIAGIIGLINAITTGSSDWWQFLLLLFLCLLLLFYMISIYPQNTERKIQKVISNIKSQRDLQNDNSFDEQGIIGQALKHQRIQAEENEKKKGQMS